MSFIRTSSNPLVLHGQHFGRTVFALCNYPALLTAGILRLEELQDTPIDDYPADVRREHRVFMELIDSYPGLLDRLTNGEEEDVIHVGELLGKGASGARGDDTKTLKSAILEWLVPRGQAVIPPLSRNIKSDRRFNHEITGRLLCPAGLDWSHAETKQSLKSGETAVCGDQWPIFLYAGYEYDPEDPWKGLLRSEILIFGFKHVFTSPSLVDKEPKATRSGNTYLHGMKYVTRGSLAYVATQVRFSLSSSSVFSRTDTVTDSKNFYHSILDLLEDPDESEEVTDLMTWWTRFVTSSASISKLTLVIVGFFQILLRHSALSKIQEKRAALQERVTTNTN
ncbi:uncharacterized protein F5147DRAFT_571027 [Suillus discolor]|uniref:Uncharacterized protein n=1 Tax=Suillus discolor TaxID=1912936 RepID=A0A9P7FE19_9AGAM|nr:uncharacterized protein F5147DRAFT_571027 [Suillus discolor]KAG2113776.1 hypothetical protein F5147DRAFT_571027 [Suillus discolor]